MMMMVVMVLARVATMLPGVTPMTSCAARSTVATRLVMLLVPRQTVNKTGPVRAPARRCRLLKAINDVSEVHGSILLVVLAGPALDTLLVKVGLLEGIQKRVYLLLNLILLGSWVT